VPAYGRNAWASWSTTLCLHFPQFMTRISIMMMIKYCTDKVPLGCALLPALFCTPRPISAAPFLPHSFCSSFPFLHLTSEVSPFRAFLYLPNILSQAMLFLSFGVFTSLVSSAAAFDAVGGSLRVRHALHEDHGKRFFNFSSVDRYRGEDFFDDTCACSLLVWSLRSKHFLLGCGPSLLLPVQVVVK
jgi:hypothetical protein